MMPIVRINSEDSEKEKDRKLEEVERNREELKRIRERVEKEFANARSR